MTNPILANNGYESPASGWDMLWVLFVLALIVGLIVVLLRFFGKRNRGWWMNRSLRSLGGLTLGTNKSLQVVEWNGRIYVVGVGENVTLLESISDPETVAALLAEHDAASTTNAPALPAWLRGWSERLSRSGASGANPGEKAAVESDNAATFEQTLEQRLRQLSERRQRVEQLLADSKPAERNNPDET